MSWYDKYDYLAPATGKRMDNNISAKTRTECTSTLKTSIQAVESGQISLDERRTVRIAGW